MSKPVSIGGAEHYDWCSGGCGGSCQRSFDNLARHAALDQANDLAVLIDEALDQAEGDCMSIAAHVAQVIADTYLPAVVREAEARGFDAGKRDAAACVYGAPDMTFAKSRYRDRTADAIDALPNPYRSEEAKP